MPRVSTHIGHHGAYGQWPISCLIFSAFVGDLGARMNLVRFDCSASLGSVSDSSRFTVTGFSTSNWNCSSSASSCSFSSCSFPSSTGASTSSASSCSFSSCSFSSCSFSSCAGASSSFFLPESSSSSLSLPFIFPSGLTEWCAMLPRLLGESSFTVFPAP